MAWAAVCAAAPVAAALLGLLPMPVRLRESVTILAALATAAAAAALVVQDRLPVRALGDTLYLDGLGLVLVVTVALVYLVASVYAAGYFDYERGHRGFRVYSRRFHVLFNMFAATLFWVPLTGNLMLLWVAVEATTVTSALLVGLERSGAAAEAAWKYILIASSGLVLGLLGLMLLYFSASGPLGTHFNPTFPALLEAASHLSVPAVTGAFALVVLGFGTKAGLFPMHTWLPDAHGEGPTPVSAMLSGALLSDAMYAIFRVLPIATGAAGPTVPHGLLFGFGAASMALAGLFALRQVNLKRLYAYSSIEHMGILALGVAFASPVALYGVMLHVVAHGATKALAFFAAGSVRQRFGGGDQRSVTGLASLMPATAAFLLVGAFAISAVPPAALFRSELTILLGGAQQGMLAFGAVLLVFANLVFLGALRMVNRMTFSEAKPEAPRGESSRTMVLAMALAAIPAVGLAFWIPGPLDHVFVEAARVVGG